MTRVKKNVSKTRHKRVTRAKVPTEASEQMVVVRKLRAAGLLFCSVPNGGRRGRREAQLLKATGMEAGVPDLLIFDAPDGARGVALEMKRVKGGRLSAVQKRWLDDLAARGWLTIVARGAQDALEQLREAGYAV